MRWSRQHGWWIGSVLVVLIGGLLLLPRVGIQLFPPRDGTWQAMQDRGTWRVGLDPSFPPFEVLNEAGQPIGFDVDLARQLAATWGLEVEIVTIGFDSLLDAVRTVQIDSVVSAYPYDPRLTRDVLFSSPYFEAGIRLVVREDSLLTDTEQLADQTIAVEWGSMGDMVGRRLQKEAATIKLAQFATPDEAVAALQNDPMIDALLIDNVTLRQAQGRGAPIQAIGPALESNPYVIVMPRTARDLHAQIEQSLATLQANGGMATLETTWFTAKETTADE
jgi:ABC-type amino acid transport substrate-binding protein